MSTTTATTHEHTYRVTGMTCGHCVTAVRQEVGAIADVTEVRVDLPSGVVHVSSARPLDDDEVAAAVDEAGYELAS
jgi:copper chaperone CopZ